MREINELPRGWEVTTLGDIVSISSGKGLVQAKQDSSGEFLVYGGNGVNGRHNDYVYEDSKLIIGRVGVHCGNIHISKPKSWITDNAFVVTFNFNELDVRYLYYLIGTLNLNKYSSSTAQPVISQGKLYPIELSICPLAEQHRIVSKIEELFSSLDKGVESLKTARQQLKVYRQAVLKWAFEGRLTNENVVDGELPEGWIQSTLGSFIEKIEAGKSFKCDERPPRENEVGVLKVSAITWGFYNEAESKTIVDHDKINLNYLVKEGDFLFSRANTLELIGAVVKVHAVRGTLLLSDKTLRIKFDKEIVDDRYILYFLKSRTGRKQIQENSSGNQESMRNVGQQGIRKINVSIPPTLTEQQAIVSEIESRLSVCDKIEESITQSLLQAEALRQSILKKAFEGKLVPQDPADEPASVLLERIKVEREKNVVISKGKKEKKSQQVKIVFETV